MWFIAIILSLVISLTEFDLFVGISDLTFYLHHQCLNFTPDSHYAEIYAALVCGKKLFDSDLTQSFKNLGIYHAIIVSGSHLVFLSSGLECCFFSSPQKIFKPVLFVVLLIYALATGFDPPVARALVGISIDTLQRRNKLFWSQNEVIFISVLVCLVLVDPWQKSFSLILSYAASVSLTLAKDKNIFRKNLKIYLFLLIFLCPLSAPGLLSFLSNMTLTPFIGFVLFPLSFLSFIVPYFSKLVDPLWNIFLNLCSLLGPEFQSFDPVLISIGTLWCLVIMMNFYGITKTKKIFYDIDN